MDILRRERGQYARNDVAYLPVPCQHCENAPCIEASDGAITKRDDGIVMIDMEKAKGNKDLVDSCPYGAIWWNEELDIAQKCIFCAHLIDDPDVDAAHHALHAQLPDRGHGDLPRRAGGDARR